MQTNNEPLVSILIPMYNVEDYIDETITSCLNQTYKNIEIIIVDDFSTDGSLSKAEKYESANVHIYKNTKKGGNCARNYAFAKSQGEYVKFMDSDDYISDDMIEKQLDRLIQDGTKQSMVFSPFIFVYGNGIFKRQYRRSIDQDYYPGIELLFDIWRLKGFNVPHCHLMHRSLVEKAGGWDETVIKNQDGEFFARIYSLADKALSVKDAFVYWRQLDTGVHSNFSIAAVKSALTTYFSVSQLLIKYRNTAETHYIIRKNIGKFVYDHWITIREQPQILFDIENKLDAKLIFPSSKKYILLRLFVGRIKAIDIIKKYKHCTNAFKKWKFTIRHKFDNKKQID